MTTDTKEASQSVSSESKKNQKTNNTSEFFHVFKVAIDPDMKEFDYCRDRITREVFAILAKIKVDFPRIKLLMNTEVSTPPEEIEI